MRTIKSPRLVFFIYHDCRSMYPIGLTKLSTVQAQTKMLKSIIKRETKREKTLAVVPVRALDEPYFGLNKMHDDMKLGVKRLIALVMSPTGSVYLSRNAYKMNLTSQCNVADFAQSLSFILSVCLGGKSVIVDVRDITSNKKCVSIMRDARDPHKFVVDSVDKHVHKSVSRDIHNLIPYTTDDCYIMLSEVITQMGFKLDLSDRMRTYLFKWLDFFNTHALLRLHVEDIKEMARMIVEDMIILKGEYDERAMCLAFERFAVSHKKYKIKLAVK